MAEFDLIARCFAPLAQGVAGADGLRDDVGVLPQLRAGAGWVVTTDSVVQGLHFLPLDPLETVARKLVRRNLSDLVAKGARARFYTLNLFWPRGRSQADLADFARGLAIEQDLLGIGLLGGDTVIEDAPLRAALTLFGEPIGDRIVRRTGARPGDDVWLTGTLGEGGLGLKVWRGLLPRERFARAAMLYQVPEPPTALAGAIAEHASASVDISDGLLADLGHLARASHVGLDLDTSALPFGAEASHWLDQHVDPSAGRLELMTCGDDYQTAFTAPADARAALEQHGQTMGVRLARIGIVRDAAGRKPQVRVDGSLPEGLGGFEHR